jgi:radical SAM protein with 4Fe4S-binding SPASM domain
MLYINYFQDHNLSRKNIQKIKEELEEIRRFKGHLEGNQYFTRIKIYFRDVNEIMGTRAGNSPNKIYKGKPLCRMCLRPCEMMTISSEGKVSVCSEDFFYSMSMGNIKEQDLLKIWSSKEWIDLRRNLIMGNRSSREACSKCDYKGFTYEMLKENELNVKPFWCLPRITRAVKYAIKRIKPNLRK